jgi:hypothetical protein
MRLPRGQWTLTGTNPVKNPVKKELVTWVEDRRYSSFHRMVRLSVYAKDWGRDAYESGASFGER